MQHRDRAENFLNDVQRNTGRTRGALALHRRQHFGQSDAAAIVRQQAQPRQTPRNPHQLADADEPGVVEFLEAVQPLGERKFE